MVYRMTKECGLGWIGSRDDTSAWGVSEEQLKRAEKVRQGDILLHYIDGVRAWGGYSTAAGPPEPNSRDDNSDWRAALPYVIPLSDRDCVWLDFGQCQATVEVSGLPKKQYHRQVAFTSIPDSDGKCIVAAIDASKGQPATLTAEFEALWKTGADGYYWEIEKSLARGKCRLCGDEVSSWIDRARRALPGMSLELSDDQLRQVRRGFLDVAHVVPKSKDGPMMPNNVRALCPTCHRVVDRLPGDLALKLLELIPSFKHSK